MKILIVLFLVLLCYGNSNAFDEIDKTPPWYKGDKPWTSISREGRQEILNMHYGFESARKKAQEPSKDKMPLKSVEEGKKLIEDTLKKYNVDSFYYNPSVFGSKMVIWLPAKAWEKFTSKQKANIIAYMKSKYKNWAVGAGRVSGKDILADKIVAE